MPHKLIKGSIVVHKDDFASKRVSDQMEMNLKNMEDIFLNHIPREKNLLQFLQKYHILGDMRLYWRLMSENKKKSS